jgi:ATP-dependent Lon protease
MNFRNLNRLTLKSGLDEDADFIPLLSAEDEDNMRNEKIPDILPILPLRNTVLFPGVVIPITVGRDKSIQLIKDYNKTDKTIGVVAQRSDSVEEPTEKDLYKVGTVAHIIKMLRMPDGNTTIIIQGKKRFRILEYVQTEPYHKARVQAFDELRPVKGDEEFQAII